jgi:hypothetical protein
MSAVVYPLYIYYQHLIYFIISSFFQELNLEFFFHMIFFSKLNLNQFIKFIYNGWYIFFNFNYKF